MPLLATSERCGHVEIAHYGVVAVSDQRAPFLGLGGTELVTPLRSVGKPFQLAALAHTGLSLAELTACEIAVMASSHNGEQQHTDVLTGLLGRVGLGETDLACGTHEPYRSWVERRPLTNNCSGKHVAMLYACRTHDLSIEDYWAADHPVQGMVRAGLATWFPKEGALGLDGCGVPTYAVAVDDIAKAYAALAVSDDPALATIRSAYLDEPFYLGGTDRIDSYLTSHYRVLAKSGSAGVWAVGIPDLGLGVAVKIVTGDENVAAIVAILVLEQLGVLTAADDPEIRRLLDWETPTWTGRKASALRMRTKLRLR
jgi:L-asparaginase II